MRRSLVSYYQFMPILPRWATMTSPFIDVCFSFRFCILIQLYITSLCIPKNHKISFGVSLQAARLSEHYSYFSLSSFQLKNIALVQKHLILVIRVTILSSLANLIGSVYNMATELQKKSTNFLLFVITHERNKK